MSLQIVISVLPVNSCLLHVCLYSCQRKETYKALDTLVALERAIRQRQPMRKRIGRPLDSICRIVTRQRRKWLRVRIRRQVLGIVPIRERPRQFRRHLILSRIPLLRVKPRVGPRAGVRALIRARARLLGWCRRTRHHGRRFFTRP